MQGTCQLRLRSAGLLAEGSGGLEKSLVTNYTNDTNYTKKALPFRLFGSQWRSSLNQRS